MGRKNKNKQRYENAPQKKVKTNHWNQDQQPIYLTQFENPIFQQFYKVQLPTITKEEFSAFWEKLALPLPVTFRINPTQFQYENLIQRLTNGSLTQELVQEEFEPIQEVPWYPGHLVWESKIQKKSLRKSASLQKLHQFIQKCNSTGLITRQELVSMLPPLLLRLQPTDTVLDMCAAPGSKTSQMLETVTQGLVIANDVDARRAYMLSHQLSRQATAQVIVTNFPAQFYPTLYINGQRLQFDKILCDVPCTGDGAARKLPSRWVKWSARDANVIHPLQLSILMRALQMCKIGGYVMYSTCSLNPIEDEAVITEIFRRSEFGSFELVELNSLEGFKGRRGLESWKVMLSDDVLSQNYFNNLTKGDQKEFFDTVTEEDYLYEVKSMLEKDRPVIKKLFEKQKQRQETQFQNAFKTLRPSLWPEDKEFMQKIGIERTMRVLPHDQDTGGFYLALIKKTGSVVWRKPKYGEHITGQRIQTEPVQKEELIQAEIPQNEDQIEKVDHDVDDEQLQEVIKQQEEGEEQNENNKKNKERAVLEPYTQINEFDWKIICEYYGIDENVFPRSQVLGTGQSLDPILQMNKKFRYVNKLAQQILVEEKNAGTLCTKLINIGCKIFERGKESFGGQVSPFRICQEGLPYVLRFVTKRKVKCSQEEFLEVVKRKHFRIEDFGFENARKKIEALTSGCFVLYFGAEPNYEAIACQYFRSTVSLMCSAEYAENVLIRYNLL